MNLLPKCLTFVFSRLENYKLFLFIQDINQNKKLWAQGELNSCLDLSKIACKGHVLAKALATRLWARL